jgi:ATP-binding cassette, subfamily C, bacterial CydC
MAHMRTIARLLTLLRPFLGWVLLSILLGTAAVAAGIGLLGTSAFLIARAAQQPSIAYLQVAIVGVRFFGISRGVFRYLERLVSHSVNFRLLAQLRVYFYQALEPLAPARLQSFRSGDLLSRAVADIETLENFYVRAVAPPVVAFVVTIRRFIVCGQFSSQPGFDFSCWFARGWNPRSPGSSPGFHSPWSSCG